MLKVAEVVPLKQGLKQNSIIFTPSFILSCRGSSIKTRIETVDNYNFSNEWLEVAEVVPLKQGLKPLLPLPTPYIP